MQPTLYEGDLVIYKPVQKKHIELKDGAIVVINHPLRKNTLLIKRVHKNNSNSVELRGDNELSSSDSRQFGKVNQLLIKGIVEQIITFKAKSLINL